ncbi:MAG: hypothetical protein E6J90_39075 [Deltaproteobacteria bacterium]|nr:MAG: hypothetical protein E6J90_39075 [Deltaproteobacteria bacterium]
MYDYFVAAMKCLNCGTMSAADSSTNMQTHLRDDASGIELGIGFHFEPLEVREQDIMASSYITTGRVSVDGRTRLLEMWRCPACGHENWARVTITGTELTEIESVVLDRKALESAQFISDGCYLLASKLSGILAQDLMEGRVNPVQVLFERLA